MSPRLLRPSDHDRARDLAALRVDEPLEPADAAFLDEHLAACAPCAALAAAYEADADLFAPLRATAPLPPRDLWARTAAAIEAESGVGRAAPAARGRRILGLPIASLAPIAAVGVVAVVVGSTLLWGAPAGPGTAGPSGPAPTAIATSGGQVAVVTRTADGSLEVRTVDVDEVCPLVNDACGAAEPSFETELLAGLAPSDSIEAILSPGRDRIVVVQRAANGADGVYVVPVRPPRPASTAATATERPAATASAATTATAEVPSGSPAVEPTATPADAPSATPDVPPSQDPGASPGEVPTATAETGPSEAPATTAPADPSVTPSAEATPDPTPEPTPEPSDEPVPSVAVTPAPDGAIEIASDVVVVGTVAAYDGPGNRFAFTARPADGSAGPDVYVWNTHEARARAITTDHASVFAGWDAGDALVSRVVDGTVRTVALNPRTGAERGERGVAAWLPTVAPDGRHAVWWDGTVRLAADGVTPVPDRGRLVLGAWPGDPGDPQVLSRGDVAAWDVAWTPDGSAVAVWTASERAAAAGRLALYAIDPATGRARLADPLLRNEPAFGGYSLEDGHLAYASPAGDGKRAVWLLAWDGDSVGKVRLPGQGGDTLVR